MKPIPNNTDWSATAAWIALFVSIVMPSITTLLTNRHQLKLRRLDLKEKAISEKYATIKECISKIGSYLSDPNSSNSSDLGRSYFPVYAYVPSENWAALNDFYNLLISEDIDQANSKYPEIIFMLSGLLKETLQQ